MLGHAERVEPDVHVDVTDEVVRGLPEHRVVGLLAVAALHVVPVVAGDLGLEGDDAGGARGGVVESGEREHRLEERDVLRADLGELLLAVVRLVGQAEAALLDEHEVALGLAGVVVDEELEEAR